MRNKMPFGDPCRLAKICSMRFGECRFINVTVFIRAPSFGHRVKPSKTCCARTTVSATPIEQVVLCASRLQWLHWSSELQGLSSAHELAFPVDCFSFHLVDILDILF